MKVILFLCMYLSVYAYELPTFDLENTNKAEIVLFSAESVLVDEKLSYIVRWKSINATNVKVTYFGEIALSGEATITSEEYEQGPITLVAYNTNNDTSDKKTINKYVEADRKAPILNIKVQDQEYYGEDIPRRYYYRRWNPRNIH